MPGYWGARALLGAAWWVCSFAAVWALPTSGRSWVALLGLGLAGFTGWAWMSQRRQIVDLERWLAEPSAKAPPRPAGPVGELSYRAERALLLRERLTADERRRREEFLSAIEASPNGVLLLDALDQIEWMNVTAASHFGIDATRDRAQRVTNLVRAPAFVAYLQSGRFDDTLSMASPTGNGSLIVAVRRYGDDMKLVLSQDVTERDRNDRMRRDFVANVSHEIRSPLTVLAGFLETMQNLPLTDSERARVLVLMRQQTDRMQALVSDLLALAQIEAAPRPLVAGWVSMTTLVQRLAADASALDKGGHDIAVHAGFAMDINGLETELFSAMWNLVSNAIRYTPLGGRVRLAWGLGADGEGWFEVTDNGPGIAKEHIPRLTERFYRVDHSRSRETGGTGLGLAIVKHVVQRHDGELRITSEPGTGASFRISLPSHRIRTAHVSAASDSATADEPPCGGAIRSSAG